MTGNTSEYNHRYYLAHRAGILEKVEAYRITHKETVRGTKKKYHLAHREKELAQMRQYHLVHREEAVKRQRSQSLELAKQFLDGACGKMCFFCGEEVLPEDLARHHIDNDGVEEREQLGISGSWEKAVEHPDPAKWATAHFGCHSRFHNKRPPEERRSS